MAKLKGQCTAYGNALAMQQTISIAGRRLQSMTKRVPKVQKRTVALFGSVTCYNRGLHFTRAFHGRNSRAFISSGQSRPLPFKPLEKLGVTKKAIFHDFAVTSQEIARHERAQNINVSQHQIWLMKGTDQVFALRRVYSGLASNRTVNLRKK